MRRRAGTELPELENPRIDYRSDPLTQVTIVPATPSISLYKAGMLKPVVEAGRRSKVQ